MSNKTNLSSIHREELARQTELTEKYFTKMKDLKIMLESSRSRVKVRIEGLGYIINEITCMPAKVKISLYSHTSSLLAHLSQRDIGELIV